MKKRAGFLKRAGIRRSRGFTLLELVIALMILLMVLSFAIPLLTGGGHALGAQHGLVVSGR